MFANQISIDKIIVNEAIIKQNEMKLNGWE